MQKNLIRKALVAGLAMASIGFGLAQNELIDTFSKLTKSNPWELVSSEQLDFDTFHPQGMTRIGDRFFLSSVEVTEAPQGYETPQDGMDRSAGAGIGHVFVMDMDGKLQDSVELADGDIYHPGGIDYDGEYVWVPVAEYRPNSNSIIYRIDPDTLEATEVLRFADHLGGVVHDTETNTLHAVSWGSRRLYTWQLDENLNVVDEAAEPVLNKQGYVDYQDCQYVGDSKMLCSGFSTYEGPFYLGAVELVDLATDTPIWQVPVVRNIDTGRPITANPFYFETIEGGLRAYFVPEDNTSRLFVYDIDVE